MSHSSSQSHRTEHFNPRDIRATFALKRPEDISKMHTDPFPSDSNEWPPKFKSHNNYFFNVKHGYPAWGSHDRNISIPVMHEPYTGAPEDHESDTSSQASNNSSGSSNGQPLRAKITREPRVHHIPILVEARDDTSSGYASDKSSDETKTAAGTSQYAQQRNSQPSNTSYSNVLRNQSKNLTGVQHKPCSRSQSNQTFGNEPVAPPRGRKASSQPPSSPPPANVPPQQGRFTTTIKFPGAPVPQAKQPSPQESPKLERKPQQPQPDSMAQINKVLDKMEKLKIQVVSYSGNGKDKGYRQLDESLTQCMLKLDDIDTDGRQEIRQYRKDAVKKIQECISLLESNIVPDSVQQVAGASGDHEAPNDSEQMDRPTSNGHSAEHTNGHPHASPKYNGTAM